MATNKRYYWLKLKSDFFNDKRIKRLRKIAGGDTYTIIYLKMLLRSLENDGRLYFEGIENTFVEELALDLDEDEENVQVTISYLIRCSLIEQGVTYEDGTEEYILTEVNDLVGTETASARRVRKHREMLQCNTQALQCNTDVTLCNNSVTQSKSKSKSKSKELDIELQSELELQSDIERNLTGTDTTAVDNYVNKSVDNSNSYIVDETPKRKLIESCGFPGPSVERIVKTCPDKPFSYMKEKIDLMLFRGIEPLRNIGYLIGALKDDYQEK